MKKKVLIDGFNLALEQGTGVATYARNLSYNLRQLHCEVDVLYGIRRSPSFHPLITEISFFDPHVGKLHPLMKRIQDFQRTISTPFGTKAYQIPLTGTVIIETFRSRMPHYDRIWNVPYLFNRGTSVWRF